MIEVFSEVPACNCHIGGDVHNRIHQVILCLLSQMPLQMYSGLPGPSALQPYN